MTKHADAVTHLSVAELEKRVAKAAAMVDDIQTLFPGLVALPEDERKASDGRLRNGELGALLAVLDVAEHMPASFQVLADRDGGSDPNTFEIDVLREKVGRVKALDALATHLEELGRDVRDTQLAIASEARRPILAAYEIAKPLAKHDDKARTKLTTALDFYGATGRKAAKTRAEKNAAKTI